MYLPCGSAGTVLLSLLLEDRLELLELPEGAVGPPGSKSLREQNITLLPHIVHAVVRSIT